MKILLFGGSGWLGHNIALNLVAKNYQLTIVTRGRKQTFLQEIAKLKAITSEHAAHLL